MNQNGEEKSTHTYTHKKIQKGKKKKHQIILFSQLMPLQNANTKEEKNRCEAGINIAAKASLGFLFAESRELPTPS